MVDRQALEGGEFDWFAVDADGHVGHFSTAGYGPIPKSVLRHYGQIKKLNEHLLALPVNGEAQGHLPGTIDDWLEMARRGLFSYDWQHWKGPYRRAATPSSPLTVDHLPTALQAAVKVVHLTGVRFAESFALRPEELCECE
jgi:hypothetical protein